MKAVINRESADILSDGFGLKQLENGSLWRLNTKSQQNNKF